jgi:hypothetical protein
MMYLGYAIWGLDAFLAIVIFCMRRKIALAIAVIKTAALFVKDVWSVLIVPPIMSRFY